MAGSRGNRIQQSFQLLQKFLRIANDREVGTNGGFLQFSRINVDLNLVRVSCEIFPIVADLADIQPATDHKKKIGILYGEIPRAISDRSWTTTIQRVIRGEAIMTRSTR